MQETNEISDYLKNEKLKIKINSNENPYPAEDIQQMFLQPGRLTSYFILLVESGTITYKLDLQEITLSNGHF